MNAKVFINYRREDSAPYAGRLYDRLTTHFGEGHVFIDIDQIEPGDDFVEAINRKISARDIAIVTIGPNWLRPIDASGKRRIDDAKDFVRMASPPPPPHGSPESHGFPVYPVSSSQELEKEFEDLAVGNACTERDTARERRWKLVCDLKAIEKKSGSKTES